METRWSGPDDGPVALVLPGSGYGPACPLLHWPIAMLTGAGWRTGVVHWDTATEAGDDPVAFAGGVLEARGAAEFVVAKSFGCFAAPAAARLGLAGIWLTPVATDPRVAAALRAADDRSLVVGGTADPLWDASALRGTGAEVLAVPGADHSLELGDWRGSLAAQSGVFERVAAHLPTGRSAGRATAVRT